jgi:ATP-dependent helicase HrpA
MQRNDFKLEHAAAHLFMNFRVVDEHGRQLGMGRHLATPEGRAGWPRRDQCLPGAGGAEGLGSAAVAQPPAPTPALSGSGIGTGAPPGGWRRPSHRPAAWPHRARRTERHTAWTFGDCPN